MQMKYLILLMILFVCSYAATVTAVNAKAEELKKIELSGIIKYTARAKDVRSLCYSYVLENPETGKAQGIVAEMESFQSFLGEPVLVTGMFIERKREFDQYEQRPVSQGDDILCKVFYVENIKQIKEQYPAKKTGTSPQSSAPRR
ncbi:MAG: hypothetical protein ACLFP8_02560 [Alphaproteobacteria bacterium]